MTRPTTATLPESITAEGKANGRESSKRRDEERREGGKEGARARESRLFRGKRRAPATSSLTAVNGRSLRRNTVRERGRKNKRPRQMDEDGGKMGKEVRGRQREKRRRKRRYLYYLKKSDRENRETGRLRPWQPARSLAGDARKGPGENSRLHPEWNPRCTREGRYSIRFKGHAHRSIAPRSFSMQNKILQIRTEAVTHTHTPAHVRTKR